MAPVSRTLSVLAVPVGATLLLFVAALVLRPLIPVGETRYLTVAWEMRLQGDWLAPLTLNFEPYHHKPPLLFWMIDAAWAIFGVSRWAAMVPLALMVVACIVLTGRVARETMSDSSVEGRAFLAVAASAPMVIYGTTVMFDMTMTAFLLAAALFVLRFARSARRGDAILAGVAIGLAVLTKGPVAYVYILPLMLLAPWWTKLPCTPRCWYFACAGVAALGLLPVALWIIPIALRTDGDFLVWLLWNQTAGRITGSFGEAHVRPFHYYLPMIPVLFLPWVLLPSFWRGIRQLTPRDPALRMTLAWGVPPFVVLSLIGGKQAHYLVPLMPAAALFCLLALRSLETRHLKRVLVATVAIALALQLAAARWFLPDYDPSPIAEAVRQNSAADIAFAGRYEGELGYLARLRRPVDEIELAAAPAWLAQHPDGVVVARYAAEAQVNGMLELLSIRYRRSRLGLFGRSAPTQSRR